MDKLLQNENMNMRLTPYKVLATSSKHGFVQYIDSVSIAEILRKESNIQNFLRLHAPCESSPFGISSTVMETFVRSCAGYCIITYILGIGDRHFDNLLMTRQGNLFHIDFGYILGRDPKPLPPPMKLTKEMVEAMGGQSSELYNEFRRLCYTTFIQLRRHSSLVLHLFSLMVDASVPDIALEPDKTTKKVEDRFCLSLGEEETATHVQEIIDTSLGAVMAVVVEQFHRLAMFIRK
ncbi:UNVERIFIED_CONTAM: hypothetical protein GTU68_017097 [Idotea baltica]|nr:hypothetical protein [Idotea baltica]